MVASVGTPLQQGAVNPFQKQIDEQNRHAGKTGQDGGDKTQQAKQNTNNAPAEKTRKQDADAQQNSFFKAARDNDNDRDDRANKKVRGSNLDITV